MKDNESIYMGHILEKLRKSQQKSQEDVAEAADLSREHIGRLERNEKQPTFPTIVRIANALDMNGYELMKEAEKGLGLLKNFDKTDDPE